ncbi:MAG: phosphate/phosphite/phosphonate ABC transporter substrate-binding protein [Thiobacillus sp.]|nr:phosphate/phosphite/phosphonate ABC transporter substrate-binding protein [Thiobacillus sp.]
MKSIPFLLTLAFVALLVACEKSPQQSQTLQYTRAHVDHDVPIYRFAIHPLHNPQKLSEAYQPLIDYLNRQIPGVRIELEASRDYQVYEQKFRGREPTFLLPNPWQTLQAMKVGYQVIAMAGDAEDFRGVFVVRKNSGIRTPADLRGKVVSYPSYTALAAAIMPQYYLHTHGIDINKDIQNNYVGSQESSIMNVYLGKSAAGATWPPPWRSFQKDHPEEAAQLEVIWVTPPLVSNSVMARDDVPVVIREQVRKALLELAQTAEGRAILGGMETARFHPADNASYDVVRDYIARFEQEVRPVERK